MKPTLEFKLGTQLVITPQLQQAIHLLQLSTLDLQNEVQAALEANPLLEREEEQELWDPSQQDQQPKETPTANEVQTENTTEEWRETPELTFDTSWDDIYSESSYMTSGTSDEEIQFENSAQESLTDHLRWQLNMSLRDSKEYLIGEFLIESLDSDGYLRESLENLIQSFKDLHPQYADLELQDIENILYKIQLFEPTGVGARDLRECLLIQLASLPQDTPYIEASLQLVDQYLSALAQHDYKLIMRRLRLSEAQLKAVIYLIQAQNPRPGSQIGQAGTEYITPDLIVKRAYDQWVVELNPEAAPKLKIQPYYANLIQRSDTSDTNTYLKEQYREAQWLLKSLQSRYDTLLKVGRTLMQYQQAFLEQGEIAMKPLILHDIAEVLGMHESTISRATTHKYIHTPRGIFELKYFFSSHLSTQGGGECSSTAIRARIRELIAQESPKKPLSDSKLADLLQQEGIQVARRTIAKYREALNIPASSERKRLFK
ncbi:RNA polymerase sigma-54 factor [Allopseudospirillum japonicum]|uniref:RNA polymerase sigma-54 factor n=1 Tax=Allopseudospirillum japonicum TaxID=64971 RepID=A0A1H6QKR5_9GAMM|nr:RNA polymerase factor sigma-54 [Allopseudospirillum japonicum]SEI40060.1 RNA polymerase sigma-54 factor [Allopseudospirillum japonicum]